MTTLTLNQRIKEGDSEMEREISLNTDSTTFDITDIGARLIALLEKTTWTYKPSDK